jgi:hypothetical protein
MPIANAHKPHSRQTRRPSSAARIVELPRAGCDAPVPDMPEGRDWSDIERNRWEELWSSPQASQWDESYSGQVGMMIVHEQAIFHGEGSAWMAQESRHIAESLGLTAKAMAALGWKVSEA